MVIISVNTAPSSEIMGMGSGQQRRKDRLGNCNVVRVLIVVIGIRKNSS